MPRAGVELLLGGSASLDRTGGSWGEDGVGFSCAVGHGDAVVLISEELSASSPLGPADEDVLAFMRASGGEPIEAEAPGTGYVWGDVFAGWVCDGRTLTVEALRVDVEGRDRAAEDDPEGGVGHVTGARRYRCRGGRRRRRGGSRSATVGLGELVEAVAGAEDVVVVRLDGGRVDLTAPGAQDTLGFSRSFLLDAVRAARAEHVDLAFDNERSALRISPADRPHDVGVVMPIRLRR